MSNPLSQRISSTEGTLRTPTDGNTLESDGIVSATPIHTCTADISPSGHLLTSSGDQVTVKPGLAPQESQVDFQFDVFKSSSNNHETWQITLDTLPKNARDACIDAVTDIIYRVSTGRHSSERLTADQRAIFVVALATSTQPLPDLNADQQLEIIESFIQENGVSEVTWLSKPYTHAAVKTNRALPILRQPATDQFTWGIDLVSTNGSRFYFIEGGKPNQAIPPVLLDQLVIQLQKSRNLTGLPDDYTIHAGCRSPLYMLEGRLRGDAINGHWIFFDRPRITTDPSFDVSITVQSVGDYALEIARISAHV